MTLIPFEFIGYAHRWRWHTGILKSHSGLETRIAYLQSPAEGWNLQAIVDTELNRRNLRLALFLNPVEDWTLAVRHESVPVKEPITGVNIFIDATYVDWKANGTAVYVEGPDPEDAYETTIVGSLGALNNLEITLADGPPAGSFPAGLTRIMPIIAVDLEDGQPTNRDAAEGSTDEDEVDQGAGVWTISARSATFGTVFGTGATVTTHDSIPVLDRRPYVENTVEERFVADLRRYDFGNALTQEWSKPFADIGRAHAFIIDDDAERQWWKKFLTTIYGMQVAFLLPTWQPDLDLSVQPSAPYTALRVDQTPGFASWFASAAHQHLQLIKADGTVVYTKATAVVDNMDGTETITVTPAVGAGPFARVSLLELVRLQDDEVVFTHVEDRVELELRVLVVQR